MTLGLAMTTDEEKTRLADGIIKHHDEEHAAAAASPCVSVVSSPGVSVVSSPGVTIISSPVGPPVDPRSPRMPTPSHRQRPDIEEQDGQPAIRRRLSMPMLTPMSAVAASVLPEFDGFPSSGDTQYRRCLGDTI